jgi:hypothetical protein
VERVLKPVAPDHGVEILRRILRRAGAEAVEAQRKLVVAARVVVVFAARVELAEDELPVVAALFFIPVHGAAAAEILHLDGAVLVPGHGDDVAVALARLVDRVG